MPEIEKIKLGLTGQVRKISRIALITAVAAAGTPIVAHGETNESQIVPGKSSILISGDWSNVGKVTWHPTQPAECFAGAVINISASGFNPNAPELIQYPRQTLVDCNHNENTDVTPLKRNDQLPWGEPGDAFYLGQNFDSQGDAQMQVSVPGIGETTIYITDGNGHAACADLNIIPGNITVAPPTQECQNGALAEAESSSAAPAIVPASVATAEGAPAAAASPEPTAGRQATSTSAEPIGTQTIAASPALSLTPTIVTTPPSTSTAAATVTVSPVKTPEATPTAILSPEQLPQSNHIILDLYPQDLAKLKDPGGLLAHFDAAYDDMAALMGYSPYSGSKITLKETDSLPSGYVLLSGNPIQWSSAFVPSNIDSANNHKDVLWGPIHELGHDFDVNTGQYYIGTGSGMINPEFWASFKAAYALGDISSKFPDAMIKLDSYSPSEYVPVGQIDQDYFVNVKANSYLSTSNPSWTQSGDADILIGLFLKEENKIGWDPFVRTMHAYSSFHALPPANDDQKINVFMYLLSKYSGQDVAGQFVQWGFPTNPSNQEIADKWVSSAQS